MMEIYCDEIVGTIYWWNGCYFVSVDRGVVEFNTLMDATSFCELLFGDGPTSEVWFKDIEED